jgi:hypothetical protein
MRRAIAVTAMAALVVIAGITGASSAAHAAVFFTAASRNGSDVVICAADKWFLSPLVPLILHFLSCMRVRYIIVHRFLI